MRLGEQYDCDAGALSHDLDRGHAQAGASINTSKVEIISGGAVRWGEKEDELRAFMAIEREICQKGARCLDMGDSTYRVRDMSEGCREERSWEWAFIYERGQ